MESKGDISRRQFLKGTAAAAGTLVLTGKVPLGSLVEGLTTPEKQTAPKMLLLDIFAADELFHGLVQKVEEESGKSEKELLVQMGISDSSTDNGLREGTVTKGDLNQAKLFATCFVFTNYSQHGENVDKVREKAVKIVNPNAVNLPVERKSIVGAIKIKDEGFDDDGNVHAKLAVDSEVIKNRVISSDAEVVSMSFQVGETDISYIQYGWVSKHPDAKPPVVGPKIYKLDGSEIEGPDNYKDYFDHPITKEEYDKQKALYEEKGLTLLPPGRRSGFFKDFYAVDLAYNNLSKIAEIAAACPEKTFVVAGGNPYQWEGFKFPHVGKAREQLIAEGKWRENIIVVGFEGILQGVEAFSPVDGADICIDNKDLMQIAGDQASSDATPIVAEVVRKIRAKGIKDPQGIKAALGSLSKKVSSFNGDDKLDYPCIDFEKIS